MVSVIQRTYAGLAKRIASNLFRGLAAEPGRCDFSVRLWDGTEFAPSSDPRFTLVINNPGVLARLFDSPSELTLGECFICGDLDVEGSFDAALEFTARLASHSTMVHPVELRLLAAALPHYDPSHARDHGLNGDLHSRERDRSAIASHYDVSNDFYKLWLDEQMVYSEAYFESPSDTLDVAQRRKLDHVCRKLRLRSGERLLDIGCGWGGLMMHAAAHYGAYCLGVTLSTRQAELARERIRAAGLSDRCAVRLCDYRDIESAEPYDKISSIGMVEHVGRSMLPQYFRQAHRLLRPGGVFLNSGIAASATYQRQGASFIDKYVFPDGDLVPLYDSIREAESCGFEVNDVEELREHYALTLDRWVERLEQNSDEARIATDDVTYRTWKLYMAASAYGFRTGRIKLYHLLLSKPDQGRCAVPLTRKGWYDNSAVL